MSVPQVHEVIKMMPKDVLLEGVESYIREANIFYPHRAAKVASLSCFLCER